MSMCTWVKETEQKQERKFTLASEAHCGYTFFTGICYQDTGNEMITLGSRV